MAPGSAVSGLYFGHPEARYFQVSPIDKDQMEDYAKRKDLSLEECERWLAPNRGYKKENRLNVLHYILYELHKLTL